jgi:hypothetical protein
MKIIVSILTIICLGNLYSQVQGPNQPEFTNFSSVNNQSLVNEISGDFNYHIPLLTIPGSNGFNYELKMTYNSDLSPSEEPSWIGWGWSMNIGSITRMKNGFADDFNNVDVIYFNQKKDNVSVNLSTTANTEILSNNMLGVGLNLNLHYNNQNGYYMSFGGGVNAYRGLGNLDFGFDKSGGLTGSYSFNLTPSAMLSLINDLKVFDEETTNDINEWASGSQTFNDLSSVNLLGVGGNFYNSNLSRFNSTPINFPEYTTKVYKGRVTGRFDAFPKVGLDVGLNGNVVVTKYKQELKKKAYGYYYSDEANLKFLSFNGNTDKIKMDYTNSKNDPYIKRDRFLGIPFSNPDEYLVQVEGLSGGFRANFDKSVHFSPNYQKNESSDLSIGATLNFGTTDFGVGFPLGLGLEGKNEIIPYRRAYQSNNKYFSFHNDKSLYLPKDALNLDVKTPVLNKKVLNWGFDDTGLNLMNNPTNAVSTYIEYHTVGELVNGIGFNKELRFDEFSLNGDNQHSDLIAEFKITNSDGNVYVFGQPVFSKSEKSISYGLDPKFNHFVENNYFYPKKFEESQATSKVGQKITHPYANSYLITEIRNSNYFDVKNDGPTVDDVGDYIKFEYSKISGAKRTNGKIYLDDYINDFGQWYKWRIPYDGFNYSRGDLANIEDDVISFSEGKKELFYPKSISTKTHIAIFISNKTNKETKDNHWEYFGLVDEDFYLILEDGTKIGNLDKIKEGDSHPFYELIRGSGNEREDNWPANPFGLNIFNYSMRNREKVGNNPSRKLEKILLFTLDKEKIIAEGNIAKGHYYIKDLVKVINFEQDNSLQANQPNSKKNTMTSKNHGKLTLKKLWYDYGGIFESKISPYEFDYTYPSFTYQTEYAYLLDNYGSTLEQNPDFSRYISNPWNKYQYDGDGSLNSGKTRTNQLLYSVDQTPAPEYDPAAWRLKRIVLPSQGEIHVQYEPKDYSFVQNRKSKVLNRVTTEEEVGNKRLYKLDITENFEEGLTKEELIELARELRIEYTSGDVGGILGKNKKIYAKFLFNYTTDITPEVDYCNSEYIEGFVDVESIIVDSETNPTWIKIELKEDYLKSICLDKYKNTRIGMVPENTSCSQNSGHSINDVDENILADMLSNINKVEWSISNNFCKKINVQKSFFRIPMIRNKIAGGARAKRVMFYDKFNEENELEDNESQLYGYEYIYEDEFGNSSGVASNEPAGIGKENALIEIIKTKDPQSTLDEFLSGKDRDQSYGPIGENILPSPKITYSRITRKRIGLFDEINFNSTSDGFIIKNYLTTKDYPFDAEYSLNNSNGEFVKGVNYSKLDNFEPFIPYIPTPIYNFDLGYYYAMQGFLFVNSNLPGLLSSELHYSGDYFEKSTWNLKYSRKMNYTEPGECVPLFKGFNYGYEHKDNPFIIEEGIPGIEIESMTEAKTISEESIVLNANFDLDFFFIPPFVFIPIPTAIPTLDINKRILKDYTTNTIVNFSPIVKSIEEYKDGIKNVQQNLVFDHKSGNPILTRDMDEFDGATTGGSNNYEGGIYNYSIPASYSYESYNKISEVINKSYEFSFKNVSLIGNGSYMFSLTKSSSIPLTEVFQNGDFVLVSGKECTQIEDNHSGKSVYGKLEYVSNSIILVRLVDQLFLNKELELCEDNLSVILLKPNKNNKINEISDYISVYGGITEEVGCNFFLPNHFSTIYTPDFTTNSKDNRDITLDFNNLIQSKITSSSLSSELVDLSTYDVPYSDPINGTELISDTSSVQFYISIDSTVDESLPLDSLEVSFSINQKNTLSTPDSIKNLQIVDDLNSLLNEQWNRSLISYKNTQNWFNQCVSTDTTGLYINNYYQGIVDSTMNITLVNNSIYQRIADSYYSTFVLDSNKNLLQLGSELITEVGNSKSFISFRDLDTNYNIGSEREGYLGKNDLKFKMDTLVDYFNIGNIKYLKPNCDFNDIQSCFEEDCRDTLLKNIPEFAADWDSTFIILPGNSSISQKLYFPTNDSLFRFIETHSNFTDNFGYFSVNQNGKLEYNTIDSAFGYNISSTTELFKIYELDSVVEYDHIEEHKFIVDPNQPITSFDLDTNNGSLMVIKPFPQSTTNSIKSYLDFKGKTFPKIKVSNVVNAKTITFSKPTIIITEEKHNLPQTIVYNEYVNYEKDILNYSTERIYNPTSYGSGLFDDFYMYFHRDPSRNSSEWRKLNSNVRDQNNYLIESKSLNGIYSAIQYNRIGLTSAVITNSNNESFYFDSFEYPSSNQSTDIIESVSHTGNNSIELTNTAYNLPYGNPEGMGSIINMPLTDQLIEQGIFISLWLKVPKEDYKGYDQVDINQPLQCSYTLDGNVTTFNFAKKAQTGDWSLFEYLIPSDVFLDENRGGSTPPPPPLPNELPISITLDDDFECTIPECLGNEKVYIDDLLVRPYRSNTKCYIYNNKNDKLISILDENHFATYFQYNAKGDLIRKRKETYDGLKTIADAQYNTPKTDRPVPEQPISGIINPQFELRTNHFQNYRVSPSEILDFKNSQPKDTELNTKFNLIDIKLNADSSNIKFFDIKLNEGVIKDSLNFNKYIPNDSTVTPGINYDKSNSIIPDFNSEWKTSKERFKKLNTDTINIERKNPILIDSLKTGVRR